MMLRRDLGGTVMPRRVKVKIEILNPKKEAITGLTLEYETAASSKGVAAFRLPPSYGYKITIGGGSVEEATTITCP